MNRRKQLLIASIAGALLASACSPAVQSPSPEMIERRSNELAVTSGSASAVADINRTIAAASVLQGSNSSPDYRIGPEDLLEITLFNIPEADGKVTPRTVTVRVSHQGQISLPVVGEIEIKGLTVSDLEQKLRQQYDKYIYHPQVGVLIKEFRQKVSVIGAVLKPGTYELTGPKTVIESLAVAGGISEKAGTQVHIYRIGASGRETHVIDLAVLANSVGLINADNAGMINMPVQPGDMINVPEAGMFFVDGAVHKPGSYALGRRYSLTQALATAGGVNYELYSSEISIFRRKGPGNMQTISLDLARVMEGNAPDPQIQADDVIVVPTSMAKFIVKRFVGTLLGGMSIGQMAR